MDNFNINELMLNDWKAGRWVANHYEFVLSLFSLYSQKTKEKNFSTVYVMYEFT